MSSAPDVNDRHMRGELGDDPRKGAAPANEQAKRKAELEPRVLTVREILLDSMKRALNRETQPRCTTGHHRLDALTGGLRPGHVWVFGAETNWGKSSWLVAVADENILAGKKVLIVSSEDSETLYGDRLLARRSRVNYTRLRDSNLNRDEQESVSGVVSRAENIPVFLDGRGKTIEVIAKQANALVKEHGIDLVAFDYLQEFKTTREYMQHERVKFRDIAAQMRDVIKGNNITGIIFSQVTIQDGKKHPDKHSIRESRDVSNAAEVVALGFTPDKDVVSDGRVLAKAGDKCINVDKAKDGQKGKVTMRWDSNSACFDAEKDPNQQTLDRYDIGDDYAFADEGF